MEQIYKNKFFGSYNKINCTCICGFTSADSLEETNNTNVVDDYSTQNNFCFQSPLMTVSR